MTIDKDACCACIIFEIIQVFINVHHAVSLSSFAIPIKGIFIETILKCSWNIFQQAFMLWEGFKAQGCISCLHNVWHHQYFHQHSSCSVIVIILHSHQWSKLSWNVMERHPFKNPTTNAIIHRPYMLSDEWGQRSNSFNLCMYVVKFDMVR